MLEDGAVLTCGGNGFGQLGHGNAQDRLQPARLGLPVFGGARVVLVACGEYHTLAVTGGGRVYSCGDNSEGQLGHGNTTDSQVFTLMDAAHFEGARIVMAACGFESAWRRRRRATSSPGELDMTRERPTLPAVEPTTGRRASVVRASSQAIRVIVDCIETPDCIEKRERGRSLPFPFPFYSLCLSFFLVLLCERGRKGERELGRVLEREREKEGDLFLSLSLSTLFLFLSFSCCSAREGERGEGDRESVREGGERVRGRQEKKETGTLLLLRWAEGRWRGAVRR